ELTLPRVRCDRSVGGFLGPSDRRAGRCDNAGDERSGPPPRRGQPRGAGGAAPASGIGRDGGGTALPREADSGGGGARRWLERCCRDALGAEPAVEAALAAPALAGAGRAARGGRGVLSRGGAGDGA